MLFWLTLIVLNAVLGVFLLHKTLKKLDRYRKIDEERDSKFPSWRRYDAANWGGVSMYIGAATIMIPRILGFWFFFSGIMIWSRIFFVGKTINKGDSVQGIRRTISGWNYAIGGYMSLLCLGIVTVTEHVHDVDYSKYIGRGFPPQRSKSNLPGAIVCNHMGFFDIIALMWSYKGTCAFLTSAQLGDLPIVGYMCKVLECIFVTRGSGPEVAEKSIEAIENRMKQTEEEGKVSPLVIFAEGGTTNGTTIGPLKRGAFTSLRSIEPVVIDYSETDIAVAVEVVDEIDLFVLLCASWSWRYCTVRIFPHLKPNQHLLNLDVGTQPWQKFAWATRDIMSKYGKKGLGTGSIAEKRAYRSYMMKNVPECPPKFHQGSEDVMYSESCPPPEHANKYLERMQQFTEKKKNK